MSNTGHGHRVTRRMFSEKKGDSLSQHLTDPFCSFQFFHVYLLPCLEVILYIEIHLLDDSVVSRSTKSDVICVTFVTLAIYVLRHTHTYAKYLYVTKAKPIEIALGPGM